MIACSSSIKVHIIGKTISHYRVIEKFAAGGIWCCVQAGVKTSRRRWRGSKRGPPEGL